MLFNLFSIEYKDKKSNVGSDQLFYEFDARNTFPKSCDHHTYWLLNFALTTIKCFFFFLFWHNIHDFKTLFEVWTRQTTAQRTFPLCLSPFQKPATFLDIVLLCMIQV